MHFTWINYKKMEVWLQLVTSKGNNIIAQLYQNYFFMHEFVSQMQNQIYHFMVHHLMILKIYHCYWFPFINYLVIN